jgi:hypothetical protein
VSLLRFDLERPWPLVVIIGALIVAISPIVQLISGTNSDTSWLITVVERMRNGEILYRDILELNPPFSIWLYQPPVLLALALGLSPEWVVHLYTVVIGVIGVGLTAWIGLSGKLLTQRNFAIFSTIMLIVFIFMSVDVFAQREHIAVVLMTPILALGAWRAAGQGKPQTKHWLAAGLTASVLPMVKPHYIPILIIVAAWHSYKARKIQTLFLPEYVVAGVLFASYVAVAYVAYPDFFKTYMPLLRDIYTPVRLPFMQLILFATPGLILTAIYFFAFANRTDSQFSYTLFLAAIVAWLSYFLLGKGWAYHAYPALYFALVALLVANVEQIEKVTPRQHLQNNGIFTTMTILAVILCQLHFFQVNKHSDQFIETIRTDHSNPTVAMLGADIAVGHPLTRQIGGRWIEQYCSDWLPRYALNRARMVEDQNAKDEAARYEKMADTYFKERLSRLLLNSPDLLIVSRKDDITKLMLEKYGFDKFLTGYSLLASEKAVDVYQIRKPLGTQSLNDITRRTVKLIRPPFLSNGELPG